MKGTIITVIIMVLILSILLIIAKNDYYYKETYTNIDTPFELYITS